MQILHQRRGSLVKGRQHVVLQLVEIVVVRVKVRSLRAVQITGSTIDGGHGNAGLSEAAGGEHALAADVHTIFFAQGARFLLEIECLMHGGVQQHIQRLLVRAAHGGRFLRQSCALGLAEAIDQAAPVGETVAVHPFGQIQIDAAGGGRFALINFQSLARRTKHSRILGHAEKAGVLPVGHAAIIQCIRQGHGAGQMIGGRALGFPDH